MYRLKVELNNGEIIDKYYSDENIALNLYGLALFKKLAKYAMVYDTMEQSIIFEFHAD